MDPTPSPTPAPAGGPEGARPTPGEPAGSSPAGTNAGAPAAAHGSHRAERRRRSGYAVVTVSAALGLGLCLLGAVLSPELSLAVTCALVLIIAWGWPAASGAAELRGDKRILSHTVIIGLAGLAAAALMHSAPLGRLVSLLPAVIAVGVVAGFIAELTRGEGAFARLESVISVSCGILAAVSAAGWVGMAQVYLETRAGAAVWIIGAVIAAIIGVVGARLISAGPVGGPRRGAVTLGLAPVAFFGIVGYAGSFFLSGVLG